jgi:putative spermidine/putrescine transport system substrate-binding protein
MKRNFNRAFLFAALLLLVALAVACGGPAAAPTQAPSGSQPTTAPVATTAPQSSGAPEVINAYFDDDTNITDWMSNKIIPAFEKQFPQYQVKVVIVRGIGNGNSDIADRADAALKSGADPQADLIGIDALNRPATIQDGLWLKLDESNVPNSKGLVKGVKTSDWSMPYRGSQVLLGYDSSKIPENEVPKTFADLISWVKAHPGQFVYCRPDKGGSGSNFIVRAIYEVTGKDPSIFKAGDPDPALVAQFSKAWDLLRSIHSDIYQNGAYPAGNTQVLTLLSNGSVSMATVWSDQALQGLAKGVLPPNIKLAQLTDLPFPGGDAYFSIPKNSKHTAGALAFLNYLLGTDTQVSVVKDIGGFPAVNWSMLPSDLQQQYTSVIASSVPNWPGGKWGAELNKGWYDNVATNIKQGS